MRTDTSISTRISRTVVAAVGLGMTASVGLFLASDFREAMKAESLRYQSAAYAFGAAASDAVAARDPRRVLEVLRGVRELSDVVYVAALDARGAVIAEMGAGVRLTSGHSAPLFPTSLKVQAEVRKAGAIVGSVQMQVEASALRDRYVTALLHSGLLGLALVVVTAFLAKAQVSRVVRPLRQLAGEFVEIGRRSDLTRRLQKERNDEVGVLVDAFNEMFGHIDERDRLLRRHSETLEETVQQRTLDLRIARDQADAANAAKSSFLATMSHEIRTPMNGMMVMAEMLAAAPLSGRHRRYAEIITRSGKNLLHIINDILDFSKIESGKIELENIEFSLDALVEDVGCLFAERAREKGLSLAIYVAPTVPGRVIGDPVRLSQVIGNLVNNGLKFTEKGGVTISVETVRDGSGELRFTVADTGIGIAPDQVDRIFTRFSQADASITRRFGGTGLGLSISRQLTELMGGAIHVDSAVGSGSKFVVSLPLEAVEMPARFHASRPLPVLLLDSDPITREAVSQALADRGIFTTPDAGAPHEAVLLRAGDVGGAALPEGTAPLVLLRPFAATTSPLAGGRSPVAEIALPVPRMVLDRLCEGLERGDLRGLEPKSADEGRSGLPDLQHLKVLAVDDVAVNREVLSEALRTFNIECDLAESGPEAIDSVREKEYHLIFMDCSMPDMDGFEATRKIRAMDTETRRSRPFVVALTGHVMSKDAAQWKEAGMDAYLAKPFNISQLMQVFRESGLLGSAEQASTEYPGRQPVQDLSARPLLSAETLEMFESIRSSTGADIRSKVFSLFRANAVPAYEVAAAEIRAGGEDGRKLVHALKSNCSSAGAARAMALCQHLETVLASGARPEECLLEDLGAMLRETLEAMDGLERGVTVAA